MYSPLLIANKFIELGLANNTPITQMQAQKLTYIAHGVSLGHRGAGILSDPVCAWRYGPVMPSLYHALKHYGKTPICQPVDMTNASSSNNDQYLNGLVRNVFDTYGKYNAETLSEFTHRSGTPWYQTYHAGNTIISDELIKNYYQRLMARDPSCIGL
ncbi:Panacea domain-containing protein [Duffyella gerundensis]|uniref:Panacea domain-containing protein n=1 Tax=Duffyella gerundensis TaxID=1619313 RepID=UPI00165454CF|nr:type II toxin-antitoxin system antitoxin SocA domain-containing protein [Duffyella gerundensis]